MPKHLWSIPCENVIINKIDNKATIYSIIDGIVKPKDATIRCELTLFSTWQKISTDADKIYDGVILFKKDDGTEQLRGQFKMDFENLSRVRAIGKIYVDIKSNNPIELIVGVRADETIIERQSILIDVQCLEDRK